MKVLIVGGGGREHALLDKYSKSLRVEKLFSIPGNGLMDFNAEKPVKILPNIKPIDKRFIYDLVRKEKIDLVDVAQDNPLAWGVVDFLENKGIATFGPTKAASEIEWNKEWSRNFMKRHHLPIPQFSSFSNPRKAKDYVKKLSEGSFFIKASGLAAGKGVLKASNKGEVLKYIDSMKDFGEAGKTFLIEECLVGEEVSIYALSDGENFKILKSVQDNKTLNNFDEGQNTGGMGANSPALVVANKEIAKKINGIVQKTIAGLRKEGRVYKGVLYLGLIIDKKKNPKIIEFNARWGDPEAQVVLPGIKNDYVDIVEKCISGKLGKINISEDKITRVCVVGSSKGYPRDYSKVKNKEIFGITEAAKIKGVKVYGAGVKKSGSRLVASGGRVLDVVGEGKDIIEARSKAYQAMSLINIKGNNLHYRTDIGWRDVERVVSHD